MKNFLTIQNIIIVILLGLLVFMGRCSYTSIEDAKDEKLKAVNVIKALTDSTIHYKNKYGEVVAEKKSIQIDIDDLTNKNFTLTENQKELVERIKILNKDKEVISAALIEANAEINKLRGSGVVTIDTTKKTVNFNDSVAEYFKYNITIENVTPISLKPVIVFNHLSLPNKQLIEFHWNPNDKKNNKPVSFSVSNSNPYYNIYNIDSYIIPEVDRDVIKPNFWGNTKNFFKESGSTIGKIGIGVAIGIGLMII